MYSIRQALRGETEETIAPIVHALEAEGYDVDTEDGVGAEAFLLLDVRDLQAYRLNLRQRNVLKAVIQSNLTFG